jgi:exodeoxyribonuclease V alpha subunit
VALGAPTGKAAARLEEAVHEAARGLETPAAVRDQLLGLGASTLHRLLGWRPGSHSRFRHHRGNRLTRQRRARRRDVDGSLSLMARLVEAVRADARLVLVGDPGQLTSIEAGVVLGDVVGPGPDGLRIGADQRARLAAAVGRDVAAADPPAGAAVADGIVVLDRVHRYGGAIAAVAGAVRRGDADGAVAALCAAPDVIRWLDADAAEPDGA